MATAKTLKQLLEDQKVLAEQIAVAQLQAHAEAFKSIDRILKDAGLTPADLLKHYKPAKSYDPKKARAKPVAKYADTNGNSWSGRGATPRWMGGKPKEEFLIKV